MATTNSSKTILGIGALLALTTGAFYYGNSDTASSISDTTQRVPPPVSDGEVEFPDITGRDVPDTGYDYDCDDFSSQTEAQEFFEDEGGPDEDPHNLDRDGDGAVCETLR